MQNKSILKKMLVFTIIILFIGALIIPCISSISIELKNNPKSKTLTFDPFKEGWKYRKKITINHDKVTGNLVNFPILVSTLDSDLRDKAQPDGDDILFMDDKGEADQLNHEIESFISTSGKLASWVNIPVLSGTDEIIFYIYYGNPSCSNQQNTELVWDKDFEIVIHMNNPNSPITDSVCNNEYIGYGNPVYEQSGSEIIGYATYYDGTGDYHIDRTPNYIAEDDKTVEIYAYADGENDRGDVFHDNCIFALDGTAQTGFICARDYETDQVQCQFKENNQVVHHNVEVRFAYYLDSWNYVVSTFDRSEDKIEAFLNGISKGTSINHEVGGIDYDSEVVISAKVSNADRNWNGYIDEIRVSKIIRSNDWILTSYNTMSDIDGFLTFGPEERTRGRTYENILFRQFLESHPNILLLLRYILGVK